MKTIDRFEALLSKGQDNAVLRYGLGNEYLKAGDYAGAIEHLERAVAQDSQFSAAWKLYGKALVAAGRLAEAVGVFQQGIGVARAKGDLQAVKEMEVFRRRAEQEIKSAVR